MAGAGTKKPASKAAAPPSTPTLDVAMAETTMALVLQHAPSFPVEVSARDMWKRVASESHGMFGHGSNAQKHCMGLVEVMRFREHVYHAQLTPKLRLMLAQFMTLEACDTIHESEDDRRKRKAWAEAVIRELKVDSEPGRLRIVPVEDIKRLASLVSTKPKGPAKKKVTKTVEEKSYDNGGGMMVVDVVHDEDLMRLVLKNQATHLDPGGEATKIWNSVVRELRPNAGIRTSAAARGRVRWLVSVYQAKMHREYTKLTPRLREMLAVYVGTLRQRKTVKNQASLMVTMTPSAVVDNNASRVPPTRSPSEDDDTALLREIVTIRPFNTSVAAEQKLWDRVAASLQEKLPSGGPFRTGKECQARMEVLLSAVRDIRNPYVLYLPASQVEMLTLIEILDRVRARTAAVDTYALDANEEHAESSPDRAVNPDEGSTVPPSQEEGLLESSTPAIVQPSQEAGQHDDVEMTEIEESPQVEAASAVEAAMAVEVAMAEEVVTAAQLIGYESESESEFVTRTQTDEESAQQVEQWSPLSVLADLLWNVTTPSEFDLQRLLQREADSDTDDDEEASGEEDALASGSLRVDTTEPPPLSIGDVDEDGDTNDGASATEERRSLVTTPRARSAANNEEEEDVVMMVEADEGEVSEDDFEIETIDETQLQATTQPCSEPAEAAPQRPFSSLTDSLWNVTTQSDFKLTGVPRLAESDTESEESEAEAVELPTTRQEEYNQTVERSPGLGESEERRLLKSQQKNVMKRSRQEDAKTMKTRKRRRLQLIPVAEKIRKQAAKIVRQLNARKDKNEESPRPTSDLHDEVATLRAHIQAQQTAHEAQLQTLKAIIQQDREQYRQNQSKLLEVITGESDERRKEFIEMMNLVTRTVLPPLPSA